jgi:hypothetical protein
MGKHHHHRTHKNTTPGNTTSDTQRTFNVSSLLTEQEAINYLVAKQVQALKEADEANSFCNPKKDKCNKCCCCCFRACGWTCYASVELLKKLWTLFTWFLILVAAGIVIFGVFKISTVAYEYAMNTGSTAHQWATTKASRLNIFSSWSSSSSSSPTPPPPVPDTPEQRGAAFVNSLKDMPGGGGGDPSNVITPEPVITMTTNNASA